MASEDLYNFEHEHRGIAVIICNGKFSVDLDQRKGAENDKKMLEETFSLLGFKVQSHLNLTATEMLHAVEQASKDEINKTADCFACVISSHGDPYQKTVGEDATTRWTKRSDWIYGTDAPIKLSTLLNPVKYDKCSDLANKPKLFFIQACRGGMASEIIEVEEQRAEMTSSLQNLLDQSDVGKSPERTDGNQQATGKRRKQKIMILDIPLQNHFMLAWAVQPGFIAFHRESGSWYIKGLCKMLKRYHGDLTLLSIMIKVNNYVATKFHSNCPDDESLHKKKCMPWTAHQLIRDIYFTQKQNNN